jgi:hypothetical protein
LRNPHLSGNISCLNGRFSRAPGTISGIDGQIDFDGSQAVVSFAHLDFDETQWPFHGTIDFADTGNISITLVPDSPLYELTPPSLGKCIRAANIFASRHITSNMNGFDEIGTVQFHMGLHSQPWTIALEKSDETKPRADYLLCDSGGEILQLAVAAAPKAEFGQRALHVFRGNVSGAAVLRQPPQP